MRLLKVSAGYLILYGSFEALSHLFGNNIILVNAAIISGVVVLIALLVEKLIFKEKLSNIFVKLGFGLPKTGAMITAVLITIVLLLLYPVISSITGYRLILPENLVSLQLGVFLTHGIGEEVIYRGFLFRHLREDGRTFGKAAFLSLPFFAAAHLPMIASMGIIVGGTGLLLAIASSFPLAYLFERGGNTIWASALVHFAIDTVIPILAMNQLDPAFQKATILWMIASMIIPYAAFLFLRKVKQEQAYAR